MNTQNLSVDPSTLIAGTARGAMVVDLVITMYTGRKQDKATQAEVTTAKGANSKRAASVYKSLFADCKELDDITKYQSRIRQVHYKYTKPWSDTGSRLLPTALMFEYKKEMRLCKDQFDLLVQKFLDKYDTLVAAAAFQLGSLFDRNEYPSRQEVARKFRMETYTSPLPTAGDFRLDLEHEVQVELAQQYEARMQAQLEAAAQDSWTKLHGALSRLSDRLSVDTDEDGKPVKRIFKDTMVTGALELCDLLQHMNITQDPALEKARVQLEAVLSGVTPKDLRTSDGARALTKQKVDAILSAFDWGVDGEDDGDE